MNEKEIAELRRRFRADKSSISRVRGCYVNEKREIISQFDQSLGILGQTESEQLLSTLRKTLSGTLGKNLLDIPFDTRQVVEGDQHKLLMALAQLRPPGRGGGLRLLPAGHPVPGPGGQLPHFAGPRRLRRTLPLQGRGAAG